MDQQPVGPRLRKHLLLFYREGSRPALSDEETRSLRQELESWGKTLETRGELVFMADLSTEHAAAWLGGGTGEASGSAARPDLPVELVGICIIRARDRVSAMETARHSPHVGRGGLAAVHEIDPM